MNCIYSKKITLSGIKPKLNTPVNVCAIEKASGVRWVI